MRTILNQMRRGGPKSQGTGSVAENMAQCGKNAGYAPLIDRSLTEERVRPYDTLLNVRQSAFR